MLIEKDGEIKTIQAAGKNSGRLYNSLSFHSRPTLTDANTSVASNALQWTSLSCLRREKGIAKKHVANKVILRDYPAEVFARFIAKIAYGYAVERYTLNVFEKVYIVPAILGHTNDIGRSVGCSDRR
jgi:hypothetical protein